MMLQRQQRNGTEQVSGDGWFWVVLVLVLTASLFSPIGARAEEQALTVQVAGLTADDWPQAQAVVTVLGGDGRPAVGLEEASFQAQLNGSPVPVVAVTRGVDSSLAVDVVLALDVSGSMEGGALDQAKMAAQSFLGGLAPQDRVAVLMFHDTVDLILPFTEDRAAAEAAIQSLTIGGATALYQATAESIQWAAGTESSRRAVVLLSDGVDNGSALTRSEALTPAETLGVPVFAIGLGADIDREYLQELAQASGGRSAETPSPEGLAQLYQEVAEVLRGQYILILDTSELALDPSDAVTLRVDATLGLLAGSDERAVCAQQLCVTLSGVEPGERLDGEHTVAAHVVSADTITSVTFLMDGEPVAELTGPPYEFTLDSSSLSEDEHALSVEVATTSGETGTREIAVRGAAAVDVGSASTGSSGSVLVIGAVLIAAAGAVLLVLLLRRRRRRVDENAPVEEPDPEPPPGASAPQGPRRSLWEEEAPEPPPAPEREMGRLHATSGSLTGQTFPVGDTPVSIGTGHRCLVRLEESEDGQEIGAEHARVWIRDGQLVMHELRRLSEVGPTGGRWEFLGPGDVFVIGPYTFRFDMTPGDGAASVGGEGKGEVPNILRSAGNGGEEDGQQVASSGTEASSSEEEARREESSAAAPAGGNDFERLATEMSWTSRSHSDERAQGEEQIAPASAEGDDSRGSLPQFRPDSPPQPGD